MGNKNNRTNRYTFIDEKSLILFFSDTFTKREIKNIIEKTKKEFIQRDNSDKREQKLQILKKCEWELVRMSKKINRSLD